MNTVYLKIISIQNYNSKFLHKVILFIDYRLTGFEQFN